MSGKTLKQIIDDEKLDPDSQHMADIRAAGDRIEKIIRARFGRDGISVREGGSKKKGTILKCEHDLDVLAYLHRSNALAGATLAEIHASMGALLSQHFLVEPGTTSWRVFEVVNGARRDLKVDLVPGRFEDDSLTRVWLYQKDGERERLLTNPEKHIDHVVNCGALDAVCGLKLWRIKQGLDVSQFPFELLCIDLLKPLRSRSLESQVQGVLSAIAAMDRAPRVEDPANAENDVSSRLKRSWGAIQATAVRSLGRMNEGWSAVLGLPPEQADERRLYAMASSVRTPTRPWST